MKRFKKLLSSILAVLLLVTGFTVPGGETVHAAGELRFTKAEVWKTEGGSYTKLADLMKGEVPKLKVGETYALEIIYEIPQELQYQPSYFSLTLGNGLYFTSLPGAKFEEGPIEATGYEELTKTPSGTGTAPYGYPDAYINSADKVNANKKRSGELILKTKNGMVSASSNRQIYFAVDEAFINEDPNQKIADAFRLSLRRTKDGADIDTRSYAVTAADAYSYGFWTEKGNEVVSKGGTTKEIQAGTFFSAAWSKVSDRVLTEKDSKTTVQLVYPSDIELISLEETAVYHTAGRIVRTEDDGRNKTTTFEWDEQGSYSGGYNFFPKLKVPADSPRENLTSFQVTLKNLTKTVWNDTPDKNRSSQNSSATMNVLIYDGQDPELLAFHDLVDYAPDWSYQKYESYNVRLGAMLVKNRLAIPTKKKMLELTIDETDTAIIRGVTIPYKEGMQYSDIEWTASDGTHGIAPASVLKPSKQVSALITNTALGLGRDVSIKSIKLNIGELPASYDGIEPMANILDSGDPKNTYVSGEYYGWSYISCGVYGSWKKGSKEDVKSTVKFYTEGDTPDETTTHVITGRYSAPRVLNGVGEIDRTQVLGGESFHISGRLNDANWDWNPLQEPVLYMIMPDGFSYENLTVSNAALGAPEKIGDFQYDFRGDGKLRKVEVWKYMLDIGQETRGQYQPDFTNKDILISFDVKTNKRAAVGTYHINDFMGFTTKDFKEIEAVNKPMKWDRANWITLERYTAAFGDRVNSGNALVSLAERPGIAVKQAYAISADSALTVPKPDGGSLVYRYDPQSEETKKNTTVVLSRGDTASLDISVMNTTEEVIDHATLFVPLLTKELDLGAGFMPEGANHLPLALQGAEASPNFTLHYIRVKDGQSYGVDQSPQPGEYDEVAAADANMIMMVSKVALGKGDGGSVSVKYKVNPALSSAFSGMRDVIRPALDFDINDNRSIQSLKTAAVSFFAQPAGVLSLKLLLSGTGAEADRQSGRRFKFRVWLDRKMPGGAVLTKDGEGLELEFKKAAGEKPQSSHNAAYKYYADVELSDGEALSISGIPAGNHYLIEELRESCEGYEVLSFEEEGAMEANRSFYALFANRRDKTTGVFVRKNWSGDENATDRRPNSIHLVLLPVLAAEDGRVVKVLRDEIRSVDIEPDEQGFWYYDGWDGLPTIASLSNASRNNVNKLAREQFKRSAADASASEAASLADASPSAALIDDDGTLLDGAVLNDIWKHVTKQIGTALDRAADMALGALFGRDENEKYHLVWTVQESMDAGERYTASYKVLENGAGVEITNHYKPDKPDKPITPNVPDKPVTPNIPDKPNTPSNVTPSGSGTTSKGTGGSRISAKQTVRSEAVISAADPIQPPAESAPLRRTESLPKTGETVVFAGMFTTLLAGLLVLFIMGRREKQ